MDVSLIRKEINEFCVSHSDESIVRKYSRYFREGQYNAYGVPLDLIISKSNEIIKNAGNDKEGLIKLSLMLVKSHKYEETVFAIRFFGSFIKVADKRYFTELGKWFDNGINNWALSDTICGELLAPLLLKKIISPSDLEPWIKAENKFKRRAVPVAYIKPAKKGGDIKEYLKITEPLMSDTEREVHQGQGWFLREAWKVDRSIVEEFLGKWKQESPRLIFQYACEKMTSEEKERFKRTKR